MENLKKTDPEIYESIKKEASRQHENLELIASENFVSEAVLEAQGSVLTNKYAEGYPGKRWYGGCENVDVCEQLAIDRAKELFGADHANVQPHSGSNANMAVYFSAIKPGDTVLAMDLAHGGHLTHGHKMNFSGKLYNIVAYGVSEKDERIDMDALEAKAIECKPQMIVMGASAYPRQIDFERARQIADKVGAYLFVDMAHFAGLVAAGLHPNPVPHAHFVTTTTHKTLRGPRGGMILCKEEFAKSIDMNVFPGIQGGPLMHVIAGKAVAFKEALSPEFKTYQEQVIKNAKALAAEMAACGFRVVSGGTDNHLMLIDVTSKGVKGKEVQELLDRVRITANKNMIPFDKESPFTTSGIRLGSPSLTSRGMKEDDMKLIAGLIAKAVENKDDESALEEVREAVGKLVAEYPLYTDIRKLFA